MKRILAFLLVFALCFTVSACKNEKTDGNDSAVTNGTTQTESGNDDSNTTPDNSGSKTESVSSEKNPSTSSKDTSSGITNKKGLDFGGKTVTLIFEFQPSNEYGIDPSRDLELDRIKELNKKYNVKIVMKKGAANYQEAIVSSIAAGSPIGNIIKINGYKNYDFIRAGLCGVLTPAMN